MYPIAILFNIHLYLEFYLIILDNILALQNVHVLNASIIGIE